MALTPFSDDGRKGNSVEISRNKPILCHLAVHLLSVLSGRHKCLELYLLGTNNFLNLKTTGSIWLSYEAAPPSTTQNPHILCWKSSSNSANLMQHRISFLILPLLRRDPAPTQSCVSEPWGCSSATLGTPALPAMPGVPKIWGRCAGEERGWSAPVSDLVFHTGGSKQSCSPPWDHELNIHPHNSTPSQLSCCRWPCLSTHRTPLIPSLCLPMTSPCSFWSREQQAQECSEHTPGVEHIYRMDLSMSGSRDGV